MNFLNIKIDNIYHAFVFQRKKEDVKKYQNRNSAAIIVIESGMISYYQDDIEYVQTPDIAIILPKGATYSLYCHEDARFYIVDFDEQTSFLGSKIHAIKLVREKEIIEKFAKMCRLWNMDSYLYNLKLISLLYSIFSDITVDILMDKQQTRYFAIIKPSIKYLEERYCDYGIKNDDIAKMSNISTVYFRKIFTKLYGITPIRYLEMKRIEKAKELLDAEELSVTEIAGIVGFGDIYQFCRSFKRITGFTPNNYRKKL